MKQYTLTPIQTNLQDQEWFSTDQKYRCEHLCHANSEEDAIKLVFFEFSCTAHEKKSASQPVQHIKNPWGNPDLVTVKDIGPSTETVPSIE